MKPSKKETLLSSSLFSIDFLKILRDISTVTIDSSVSSLLGFCSQTFVFMSVGQHFSTSILASVGVGIIFFNVVALSVSFGYISALDTLVSQATGRIEKNLTKKNQQQQQQKQNSKKQEEEEEQALEESEEISLFTAVSLLQSLLLCIPLGLIFFHSAPLIEFAFGQEYVDGASLYLRHAVPYLIIFVITSAFTKSLQAQHETRIPKLASVVGAIVCIYCSFVWLIPKYQIRGASWTFFFTFFAQSIVLFIGKPKLFQSVGKHLCRIFSAFFLSSSCCSSSSSSSSENNEKKNDEITTSNGNNNNNNSNNSIDQETTIVKNKFKIAMLECFFLAVPSTLSVISDWWSVELMGFVAARISENEVAAFGIFFNLATISWSLGNGACVAASAFCGKILGSEEGEEEESINTTTTTTTKEEEEEKVEVEVVSSEQKVEVEDGSSEQKEVEVQQQQEKSLQQSGVRAYQYSVVAVSLAALIALFFGIIVTTLHHIIFRLYTHDEVLLRDLRLALPVFVVYWVFDSSQFCLQSVYRGAGQQKRAPIRVFCGLWFGLFVSFLFGKLLDWRLRGLIFGFDLGFVMEISLLVYDIKKNWNWTELAKKARVERIS